MRFTAILPAITIAICTAFALNGCGNNEKEVSFKSGGVTQTFAEGADAVKTEKNSFPLPVYPGAQATGSVTAKGEADEDSQFMMLTSTDKIDAVSKFYTDKLKTDGWTVNSVTPGPSMVNISASKKDTEANVMLGVDDKNQTTISLAASKEGAEPTKVTNENYTPDKLNPPTD